MNAPAFTVLDTISFPAEEMDALGEKLVREKAARVDALLEVALHLAKDHDFVCAAIQAARETTKSMHHTPYTEQWPWGAKRVVKQ